MHTYGYCFKRYTFGLAFNPNIQRESFFASPSWSFCQADDIETSFSPTEDICRPVVALVEQLDDISRSWIYLCRMHPKQRTSVYIYRDDLTFCFAVALRRGVLAKIVAFPPR